MKATIFEKTIFSPFSPQRKKNVSLRFSQILSSPISPLLIISIVLYIYMNFYFIVESFYNLLLSFKMSNSTVYVLLYAHLLSLLSFSKQLLSFASKVLSEKTEEKPNYFIKFQQQQKRNLWLCVHVSRFARIDPITSQRVASNHRKWKFYLRLQWSWKLWQFSLLFSLGLPLKQRLLRVSVSFALFVSRVTSCWMATKAGHVTTLTSCIRVCRYCSVHGEHS